MDILVRKISMTEEEQTGCVFAGFMSQFKFDLRNIQLPFSAIHKTTNNILHSNLAIKI